MSATLNGAEALKMDDQIGSIEIGKQADLIIIEENPLKNLKVLYGTGAIKLDENNQVKRVGGIKYTISNGVIYDSKKLLKEVKQIVDVEKNLNEDQIVKLLKEDNNVNKIFSSKVKKTIFIKNKIIIFTFFNIFY